ncbi:MAG: IclR family transcriptional regulator [Chloroflexota bacterium]
MTIQSLERGFEILKVIAHHPKGIALKSASAATQLPVPTVARFLQTLESLEAIVRLPDRKRYVIGPLITSLAAGSSFLQQLANHSLPICHELVEQLNETVGLSVPEGDSVHYVEQVQSSHHLQVRDWTGERYPLHATSAGKLFLAWRSEEALAAYFHKPLQQFTPHTLTQPMALKAHLSEVRQQGYAWVVDELAIGITGIAVPIMNDEVPIAAIHMSGPAYRFPSPEGRDEVISVMVAAGQKITQYLQQL